VAVTKELLPFRGERFLAVDSRYFSLGLLNAVPFRLIGTAIAASLALAVALCR